MAPPPSDRSRIRIGSSAAVVFSLVTLLATTACSAGASGPRQAGVGSSPADSSSQAQPRAQRTLRMVTRLETPNLTMKSSISGSGNEFAKRLFNAQLAALDANLVAQPYLAEQLPKLDTDSWKVSPDGQMETTYRLRPNLIWHDGQPLTASDFVFALKVFKTPGLQFSPKPQDQIESISAPDPRTVVIRWSSLYPGAAVLQDRQFEPLPEHILGTPYATIALDSAAVEGFNNLPFWSSEYVGAGPYRLARWERGAFLEGVGFPEHVLGQPRIDRVVVRFQGDENAVLAAVLAGDLDLTTNLTLRFEQAMVLKQNWVAAGKGEVLFGFNALVTNEMQFRPEYLKEPGLLDVRVRQALASTVDKQALLDGLFNGEGQGLDAYVPSRAPYAADAVRAATRYPYDPKRAEQLMTEADYAKDPSGFFARDGRRFNPDFQVRDSPNWVRSQAIMVDTWKRAGLEVSPSQLADLQTDSATRAQYPGMSQNSIGQDEIRRLSRLSTAEIAAPANRWVGSNRMGWSNAEFDGLWDRFKTTLDRKQQDQLAVQMIKLINDQLPLTPTFADIQVFASHVAELRGVENESFGETTPFFSVYKWEFM